VETFLPNIKFDFVLGLQEGIPPKPDPTGAKSFAEKMGIPPEQILFVGDSGADVKAAIAAGMFPVGVLWGFKSLQELQDSGARKLIEHPKEILSLVT
jgi:phosphoglycolate phosphatase